MVKEEEEEGGGGVQSKDHGMGSKRKNAKKEKRTRGI